ncbi:MAG: hypothetical protein JW937_08685 [Candidatus Omnitrophica bacterium]|nr:hypothetical protein [Candidatus Omnitrophota bacterium]
MDELRIPYEDQAAYKNLAASLRLGRMGTAYAIDACPVAAQGPFAWELAQVILRRPGAMGEDLLGRRVKQGNHPDLLILEGTGASGRIRIEQIRQLQERISLRAFEAESKVVIVLRAEEMVEQAANCFLKTLEEPPGPCVFLLMCAESSRLLPTVRSRCQVLRYQRLGVGPLSNWLQANGVEAVSAQVAAALAEGEASTALGWLQEERWAARRQVLEVLTHHAGLLHQDEEKAFAPLSPGEILCVVSSWVRDLWASKLGIAPEHWVNRDDVALIRQVADSCSIEILSGTLEVLEQSGTDLSGNVNPKFIWHKVWDSVSLILPQAMNR